MITLRVAQGRISFVGTGSIGSSGQRQPTAFLSHASEDKAAFVRPLAHQLATLGIRPWLDEWEIRPGDSLIQKLFEQGIATVDAVIVVVSRASVDKPWVREELDSAMVNRIQRGTRLIPIRLDDVEMPEALLHLVWLSSGTGELAISETARRVSDTLYGVDPRPTVGPRPRYSDFKLRIPGLREVDIALLVAILQEAFKHDRLARLDWESIEARIKEKNFSGERLVESIHVLEQKHYVQLTQIH
jgi:hypothetical protein